MKRQTSTQIAAKTKYTLLTNIHFCQIVNQDPAFRMECQAILVEEATVGLFDEPGYRIRGFGMDPSWPVFTLFLEKKVHFPFTLSGQAVDNSKIILRDNGDTIPLFSGYFLRLANGTALFLQSEDQTKPLDVFTSTGDIMRVWDILSIKTNTYWQAPNRPYLSYGPPKRDFISMLKESHKNA